MSRQFLGALALALALAACASDPEPVPSPDAGGADAAVGQDAQGPLDPCAIDPDSQA